MKGRLFSMIAAVLGVLCACVTAPLLHLQPPTPSPTNTSQQQQRHPQSQRNDASASPQIGGAITLAKEQRPEAPKACQPDNNTQDKKAETALERVLNLASGLSNVFIALFTLALTIIGIVQSRYMRDGLKLTRQSNATSARALAIAERGYLEIVDWRIGAVTLAQTIVTFNLKATGRTPVTVIGGEIRCSIDEPMQVAPHLDKRFVKPIQTATVNLTSRQPYLIAFPTLGPVNVPVWNTNDGTKIFFAGTIRYRDAFENTPVHVKHFAVVCIGPTGKIDIHDTRLVPMNFETDEPQAS